MITVEEAREAVQTHVAVSDKKQRRKVIDAVGYVLYEDVRSPIDMPPFRQAAVDGYALHLHTANSYTIVGEIKAGDAYYPSLKVGEAIRVFTGAAVPDTATTVIMQEHTTVNHGVLRVDIPLLAGANIRLLGEQAKEGAVALQKGVVLTPAAVGYLTSLGLTEVAVFQKPGVAVVVTGDELIEAGYPLSHGKVYESNTAMLFSALHALGYTTVSRHKIADDFVTIRKTLEKVIAVNDFVLITGGISVGEYDFVGRVLNDLAVEKLFHRVKQKPGKPLFFGKKGRTLVFGLPGNPAAVLSCFYVYVYPALQKMAGCANCELHRSIMQSAFSFTKKEGRAQFLKATIKEGKVMILEGQSSAMLQTFSLANALVYAPADRVTISAGETVEVVHLPH